MSLSKPSVTRVYNRKLVADLQDWSARSYAPYTLKMAQRHLPVQWGVTGHKDFENTAYAEMCSNLYGRPQRIVFSHTCDVNGYGLACIYEHEAVHVDQALHAPHSALFMDPQDGYKSARVREVEAYGRGTYKAVHDYCSGLVDEKALDPFIECSHIPMQYFLSICHGSYIDSKQEMMETLKNIKCKKTLPCETEILPVFYLGFSGCSTYMDAVAQYEFLNCAAVEDDVRTYDALYDDMAQAYDRAPRPILSDNFSQENAHHLLARDGFDYMGAMGSDAEMFWDNIVSLSMTQQHALTELRTYFNLIREVK